MLDPKAFKAYDIRGVYPDELDEAGAYAIGRAYVEQFLVPTLVPGDVVVMDNLAAHKVVGVREAVQAAGAHVMLLPAYSPDLNPIEQAFAKLKAGLRKSAARTRQALWDTIGQLLDSFSPSECQNYLANSGYAFD